MPTKYGVHVKQNIEAIENVQRRASKQIPRLSSLSYEDRLRKLKLPTLAYRRSRGDTIELYKILTGKYDEDVSNLLRTRDESFYVIKNDICKKKTGMNSGSVGSTCSTNVTRLM